MRLAAATWPEVSEYLKTKNSLIVPIGSTEQHGPTGLIGTDYLSADAVAREAGERLKILVSPPLSYGVSSHHMGFPGSATIRPSVYQAVLADLFRGFYGHGFRRFYVVNGHGGNEASVRAAFQELKHEGHSGVTFQLLDWWKLPEVSKLAHELYGDQEGSHATPTELSLTFHLENIERREYQQVPEPPASAWPLTSDEMRRSFVTGTMRSNPALARGSHGPRILEAAVQGLVTVIGNSPVLE